MNRSETREPVKYVFIMFKKESKIGVYPISGTKTICIRRYNKYNIVDIIYLRTKTDDPYFRIG